jgi:putative transposase
LNHFIFFGTRHLDSVAASYRTHYMNERPHQGKENEVLMQEVRKQSKKQSKEQVADAGRVSLADIRCHNRLGGLLKHHSRKAA